MRHTHALAFAALLAPFLAAAPVVAQDALPPLASAPSVRIPAQTKVLLLPVVNRSGEKNAKQRKEQGLRGDEELTRLFVERGFQTLDPVAIEKYLQSEQLDLSDEENHNRATLYKIGEALKADLIVFVVITDVDQRRVTAPIIDTQELVARVKIKVWLLDVGEKKHYLSASIQEAQSRNSLTAPFDSGARRIRNTVPAAIRESLREFLLPYSARKSLIP